MLQSSCFWAPTLSRSDFFGHTLDAFPLIAIKAKMVITSDMAPGQIATDLPETVVITLAIVISCTYKQLSRLLVVLA